MLYRMAWLGLHWSGVGARGRGDSGQEDKERARMRSMAPLRYFPSFRQSSANRIARRSTRHRAVQLTHSTVWTTARRPSVMHDSHASEDSPRVPVRQARPSGGVSRAPEGYKGHSVRTADDALAPGGPHPTAQLRDGRGRSLSLWPAQRAELPVPRATAPQDHCVART